MPRTRSYWKPASVEISLPPSRSEAVVIGAGIAGCVAASELLRSGVSVILLEKETSIGSGISSRDSAHASLGLGDNAFRLVSSIGLEATREIIRYTAQNSDWIVNNTTNTNIGGLHIARSKAEEMELMRSAEILSDLGYPVEIWEADKSESTITVRICIQDSTHYEM